MQVTALLRAPFVPSTPVTDANPRFQSERPLRVLVAGIHWPPEPFILRLLNGLVSEGIEVTVGCPGPMRDPEPRMSGLRWLPMPTWECPAWVRLVRLARAMVRAIRRNPRWTRRFIRAGWTRGSTSDRLRRWNRWLPFLTGEWDVLYFPWNSVATDCLPIFELGMPIVVSCRGAQVNIAPKNSERSAFALALRETFCRAACIHCVSAHILAEAVNLGLEPARAVVIRPAVDPGEFSPGAGPVDSPSVLRCVCVGALIWRKGLEYLIAAIGLLRDRGLQVQLDLVGDGADRQRVVYTIQDLGLENHVKLHGKLNPQQIRSLLGESDVFVFSSLSEGIPNAVLEAMACGLPVVTSDCGGVREAVTDGREGFVVPVRNPEAMASALTQLARDPELRQRLGRAGRERVLAEFTLESQVSAFADLLRRVAIGSSRGVAKKEVRFGDRQPGQENARDGRAQRDSQHHVA